MSAPSPDPEKAKIPSPTTELPFSVEQIMEGIDAMIVTHIHPDHFDPETAAMLDLSLIHICSPPYEWVNRCVIPCIISHTLQSTI